jgi:hypothetical protein
VLLLAITEEAEDAVVVLHFSQTASASVHRETTVALETSLTVAVAED